MKAIPARVVGQQKPARPQHGLNIAEGQRLLKRIVVNQNVRGDQ